MQDHRSEIFIGSFIRIFISFMRSQDRRFLTDLSVIKKQPRSDFTYVIYLLSVDALKYVRTYARMPDGVYVRDWSVCVLAFVRTYVHFGCVALIFIYGFAPKGKKNWLTKSRVFRMKGSILTQAPFKKNCGTKRNGEASVFSICFPIKIS